MLALLLENDRLEVAVSASDELRDRSECFLEEARSLRSTCPDSLNLGMKLDFEHPRSEVHFNATAAERAGITHRLRPFALSGERLYVPSYLKAFKRENRNPIASTAAGIMRDSFLVRDNPFNIQNARGVLDMEKQWQDYANAYEYHRDPEKRASLEAAFAPGPFMAEFVFLFGLVQKVKAVLAMQGLAALLLGKTSTFAVSVREPEEARTS